MIDSVISYLEQAGFGPVERDNAFADHNIPLIIVPGGVAIKAWELLRSLVAETGQWPVILGDAVAEIEFGRERFEIREEEVPLGEALFEAEMLDLPESLRKRLEARTVDIPRWVRERLKEYEECNPDWWREIREPWREDVIPNNDFAIPIFYQTKELYDKIAIALLPTMDGWNAPDLLNFGGWNDCPFNNEHSAFLKYWGEKYGAELVGMRHDIIEMQVAHPPEDRETALELAWEQFAYCFDIVSQGTETIDALAATLLDGTVWYFWWD